MKISLCIAAMLVLVYSLVVPRMHSFGRSLANQYAENVSRIEDLLFRSTSPSIVIVGSSKAARLDEANLPAEYANAALAGGNSQTSLHILLAHGLKPDLLLVEVNDTILLGVDKQLAKRFEPGVKTQLLKYWPALQTKFQPISILNGWLGSRSRKAEEKPDPSAFALLIDIAAKDASVPFADEKAEKEIAALSNMIDEATKRGIKVVLFDPPMHPKVEQMPRNIRMRFLLEKKFRAPQYRWLAPEKSSDFATSDGVHLLKSSVEKYFLSLEAKISKI